MKEIMALKLQRNNANQIYEIRLPVSRLLRLFSTYDK